MIRFIAAALLLGLAATAQAADAVIAKVTGQVYYRSAGSEKYIRAKGGEELLYGDRVRAASGSVAQIVLSGDRGAILLREDSSFVLEGDPNNTLLNFRVGEFLIGLRKSLTKGQTFRVRTPAAVAAVRGTLFWGKTDADKTTTYAGFGHVIEVTAQGKTVTVPAGKKTTVKFGEAPADSEKHDIPVSYTDKFRVGGGLQDLEKLVDLPK
jgi:hypothetical protein